MEKEKLSILRHSASHVLAAAVCEIYKDVKVAIGPAIDNGFYYDFDLNEQIKPEDFERIEEKMREIINKNSEFKRVEITKSEALKLFKGQPYKIELINELPKGEIITVYYLNDWFDLCRGPHIENSKMLRSFAFKIMRVSGAYWKGSEKNKMLQRVYVYAFENKDELKKYITAEAEALKRDHNKLGRELEIFTTVPIIGQGLPVILPNGARVLQLLQRFVEDEEQKRGYQLLNNMPLMAKRDLYKISGHWNHYRDGMFILGDPNKFEDESEEVLALRPMSCPFQFMAYNNKPRSYKDLPIKYDETATMFRKEDSGEMHGLIRVRQFTISEGHIMCMPSQVEIQFKECLELANYMLKVLGLDEDVRYRFSKWDENNKDKYIGEKALWEETQSTMRKILKDLKVNYYEADGEAAFYGPKLDVQIKNVHGKEDTLITIQIDFQLAERFEMTYTDSDGNRKYPTIIHRTSIGCYQRVLALLIEKYAGAFPLWLAPVQVKILSISENTVKYAEKIKAKLIDKGIRVEVDDRNEKIGKKIRDAQLMKIPYMLIVGDKEKADKTVSVRYRNQGDIGIMSVTEFLKRALKEIETKETGLKK